VTKTKNILMAAMCCMALAACATQPQPTPGQIFDLTTVPPPPEVTQTYPDMARDISTGSVQVFPIENRYVPPAPGPQGMQSLTDPSVTVFPLSDSSMIAQEQIPAPERGPMPLLPPAQGMNDTMPRGVTTTAAVVPPAADMFSPDASWQREVPFDSKVVTKKIYFSHGSKTINAEGRTVVAELANEHKEQPQETLHVDGHASTTASIDDPVTRQIVNLKVSMDRAFNVSRALIRKGVPASSIETRAFGDTQPAQAGEHGDVEASSRRVEITTTP
jgi:outer membrane protein OmpA-like peptidoglycan-associated protein